MQSTLTSRKETVGEIGYSVDSGLGIKQLAPGILPVVE